MQHKVTKTQIEVTLVLSESEAKWLKSYLQNPIVEPDLEPVLDRAMRSIFWEQLTLAGI